MKQLSVLVVAAFLCASSLSVLAEKPEKTQGISAEILASHPLADQIPAMDGFELRVRKITFEPGGTITEHSHKDRPGFVFILEGSMTEHRGDVARVVKAGDYWVETLDTVHWAENTTDKPAVFLALDFVPKES